MQRVFTGQPHYSPKWQETADRGLAYCEQNDIPVEQWIDAMVDRCKYEYRIKRRAWPCLAGGPYAIKVFKQWYSHQRERYANTRVGLPSGNSVVMNAEARYVHDLGESTCGAERRTALKRLRRTVSQAHSKPCRLCRIIQVSSWLHQKNRDLPDMLLIPDDWTARRILKAARLLTETP